MYKRILVPLDGSEQSEEVLQPVRMLAEINRAEIVLVRVVEYPYTLYSSCYEYPPSDPGLANIIQNKKTDFFHEVKDYLERVAERLSETGLKVYAEVCEGPIVEAILSSTDRFHVDLIAMSTCGRGKCTQCMMGSIADRILYEAQVPVFLFRPPLILTPAIPKRSVSGWQGYSGG